MIGVTSLAGPLSNLILGAATYLILFKLKSPLVFPGLLWGPVSMIQEGITFSLGQLTPRGDASWVIAMGIPGTLLLAAGILLVAAGIIILVFQLSRLEIFRGYSFWIQLLVILLGFGSLMTLRAIHSSLFSPATALENFIPLIFSLMLAFLTAILLKPSSTLKHYQTAQTLIALNSSSTAAVLCLGAGIFLLQIWIFQ
jgi:hypothetical protein